MIAGATKPEQIEANAKAGEWELSSEELAEVDRITGVSVAASADHINLCGMLWQ